MKLLNQFVILSGVTSGQSSKSDFNSLEDLVSYSCNTTELELPPNAEKWDCPESTGSLVSAGSRCGLKCDAGFIPTACKSTFEL